MSSGSAANAQTDAMDSKTATQVFHPLAEDAAPSSSVAPDKHEIPLCHR
jgi:hypothetical protein